MSVDLFTADNGLQLWRTDGTPGGTKLVTNLASGASSAEESDFTAVGNKTFFLVTPVNGGQTQAAQLWVTDGTAAGTKDLGAAPSEMVAFHDRLFFEASGGLWETDGMVGGATLVVSNVGADLTAAGDHLFFVQQGGGQSTLWSTDGTAAGAQQVTTAPVDPSSLIDFDGQLAFTASTQADGDQLWVSDGTTAGTRMVTTVAQTGMFSRADNLVVLNDHQMLFLDARTVWVTDGTTAGTVQLQPPPAGSDQVGVLFVSGGKAFFSNAISTFIADGTPGGTQLLAGGVSSPGAVGVIDGREVLVARFPGPGGPNLAVSDGSSDTTTVMGQGTLGGPFVAAAGKLFFVFGDGQPAGSLDESDGTVSGTHVVANVTAASQLAALNNEVIYVGGDGKPWITDGVTVTPLADAIVGGVAPLPMTLFGPVDDAFAPLGVEAIREGFNGDGKSDFLIQNHAGAVVVGEAGSGGAAYTAVAALGSEWSFKGAGDFNNEGKQGFLIENTAGAVVYGEIYAGRAHFTAVAGLGPEWKFVGAGDFAGDGGDQFLIENKMGSVVVGEVQNGAAVFTQVSGLGSEWKFVGAGDFLGDGKDEFLIENSSGAVVVGEIKNGSAAYTQVGSLGSEWKFVGTGDFLADGRDEFLMENAAGAVVGGEVVNGQAHYTQLTGLGPEWKFAGAGDYLGEGHDQFLIENTSGAVVVGDWSGGAIHFTQVGALGSEWVFH